MTDVLPGRRERKKEETRRKIYEAALKLFADKGFQATTIDDIAAGADVSKGTFFNYFPRKEAVVWYLFDEWSEIGDRIAAERHRPAGERLIELFAEVAGTFGDKPELAKTVARFAIEDMCAPGPDEMEMHRHHDQIFMALWQQGVESGEFRSDLNGLQVRAVTGSVFVGALTWWVSSCGVINHPTDEWAKDLTLPDVIRMNLRLVFEGLRPRRAS